MSGSQFMILLAVAGYACAMPPERHGGPLILDAVPSDVAAVYFHAGPDTDAPIGEARGAFELVAFLADGAHEIGLLSKVDSTTRLWIDALASMSVVLRYPHVIVLFDISARPRGDGGHRLAGLHAALIVDTCDRGEAGEGGPKPDSHRQIEQRIQHLLNIYANRDDTVLTTRTCQGGGADGVEARFTIRDRRLPSWATITWGPIREMYVVAIGDGTFNRIAESTREPSRSLGVDEWFASAFETAGGPRLCPGGGLGWYIHFDRLRVAARADHKWHWYPHGSGVDPDSSGLADKIDRVLASLRLTGAERGLWTVRYGGGPARQGAPAGRGRAVEVDGVVRSDGKDVQSAIADNRFLAQLAEPVIPDDATGYAIIDCNPRTVLQALCEAYLASRSPAGQRASRSFWRSLQERAGVSIERDIVSHLGRYVVIHNHPPHALRLPLMWTILIRIDGSPDALRMQIDRLFEYVRQELVRAGSVQLRRDSDGLWYSQLGINGPALAVTDQWLIISFSPQAVRQNCELQIANYERAAPRVCN